LLSFKHFHKANRGDQYREPGDHQAVTIHRVVTPISELWVLWEPWGLPNEGILQGHGLPFYPESPRRVHRYGNQKDEAHCRNSSLSVVHLSGYLMGPRETNQGLPLQRSVGGGRMKNERSKRISCEPEIQSVQFEAPRLFCAFLVFQLEGVHRRITGALQKVENERQHGVCLSGSGPEGCRNTLQALTTTALWRCNNG